MNRRYLLPKIFILFVIFILVTERLEYYYLLLFLAISTIVVAIYELANLAFFSYYYQYRFNKGKPASVSTVYSLVHRYIKLANAILRMDIEIENYEYFDKNKTYLIIPNHQSNADAIVLLEAFKTPITFVSKFSMSEVPVISTYMNLIGCLYLKKDDMRGQIKVMSEVAEKLERGVNVIIFPEGRRSFSSDMNEFKPGTFKMATKTKVDILPVTLNHVYKMKDRFPWRKTYIKVSFHKPISYEQYKDLGTQEIAEMVQSIVASKIEK